MAVLLSVILYLIQVRRVKNMEQTHHLALEGRMRKEAHVPRYPFILKLKHNSSYIYIYIFCLEEQG